MKYAFENLEVWQKRIAQRDVYQLTKEFPTEEKRIDYQLEEQLFRLVVI